MTEELPDDRRWRDIFNGGEVHNTEIAPNTGLMFCGFAEND